MKRKRDILIVYALFFAIIRPYFLQETIRQVLKLVIIFSVFIYVILKTSPKDWINIAILIGGSIIISSFIAYRSNYIARSTLFDGIYYAICIYVVYITIQYFAKRNRSSDLLRGVLDISSIYAFLTYLSLIHPLYIDDSGLVTYLFGNKFQSSYILLFHLAAFFSVHRKKIKSNVKYKCLYFTLILLSIMFSIITHCSTTILASALYLVFYFINDDLRAVLMKPKAISLAVGFSAAFPVLMTVILSNKYVQYLVINVLGESSDLNYRNIIYNNHLFSLVRESFLFGYGYNNTAMLDRTNQVFSNAQNGFFDVVLKYGVTGGLFFVFTILACYKFSSRSERVEGFSFLIYALLFAGMIEVTYNWFMIFGIFFVRWIDYTHYSFIYDKNKLKIEGIHIRRRRK